MKTIFHKLKSEKNSQITQQDQGIIENKIIELEELSYNFISKAYNIDQNKTAEFLKQARIGGYSIIGESWTRKTLNDHILDMAKKHKLKTILSNQAIAEAVDSIWTKGIIFKKEDFKWLQLFLEITIFLMNATTDIIFIILLLIMIIWGICTKAKAQLSISRTIFAIIGL